MGPGNRKYISCHFLLQIQNAKELASQTEELVDIMEKDASVAFHAVEEKARSDAMAALLVRFFINMTLQGIAI